MNAGKHLRSFADPLFSQAGWSRIPIVRFYGGRYTEAIQVPTVIIKYHWAIRSSLVPLGTKGIVEHVKIGWQW